jgi:hypothetical protein
MHHPFGFTMWLAGGGRGYHLPDVDGRLPHKILL